MANLFLLQLAVGVILLTVIKLFRRFTNSQEQSGSNKYFESLHMRGDLANLNIAEGRDTALLSSLFPIGARIFETRPVSTLCKKLLDIPTDTLRRPLARNIHDKPTSSTAQDRDLETGILIPYYQEQNSSHQPVKAIPSEAQESMSCSPSQRPVKRPPTSSPPPSTPTAPKPKLIKRGSDLYKAVRVLFLSWENERYQTTPCNILINKLRELFGMTYQFTIQECTIPTTGIQSLTPDVAVLSYLVTNGLLTPTVPVPVPVPVEKVKLENENEDEEDKYKQLKFNELVIVVYSGSGAMINGRYHLITNINTNTNGSGMGTGSEIKKMPWEWFETRLASARYDSLCILNSSYMPQTPVTAQEVRGSNMVLAAIGPDTEFRREVLAEMESIKVKKEEEDQDSGLGGASGIASSSTQARASWTTGFLETILNEFEESYEDVEGRVPVDYLFRRLVMDHDRLFLDPREDKEGERACGKEEIVKRPYLGYIKGKDGAHEDRVIKIGLDNVGRKKSRSHGKSVPPSGEEWTLVDGV